MSSSSSSSSSCSSSSSSSSSSSDEEAPSALKTEAGRKKKSTSPPSSTTTKTTTTTTKSSPSTRKPPKILLKFSDDDDSSSSSSSDENTSTTGKSESKSKTAATGNTTKASSSSGGILKIDPKYASEYERRKRREELTNSRRSGRFDDGASSDDSGSSSSEESDEDEDGDLLTSKVDLQILKTISALRNKDKSIYDPQNSFFQSNNDDDDETDEPRRQSQPTNDPNPPPKKKRYKDLIRDRILTKIDNDAGDESDHNQDEDDAGGGYYRDDEDGHDKVARLAYDSEQIQLRDAFLADRSSTDRPDTADADDDDDEEGGLFRVKNTAPSPRDEEMDRLLREEMDRLSKTNARTTLDPRGEVDDGDRFLLDFLTHKRWIDPHQQTSNSNIIGGQSDDDDSHDDDNNGDSDGHDSDASLKDLQRMDDFESKYNFRFEEALARGFSASTTAASGAEMSVVGYARSSLSDTVRRKDDSRKKRREARKERKMAERREKEEQLKRLKNAKREELEGRIQQIKDTMGGADQAADIDIDEQLVMNLMKGEYDADKFEELMSKMYDEEFYQKEDAAWKTDIDVKNAMKDAAKDCGEDILIDDAVYDDHHHDGGHPDDPHYDQNEQDTYEHDDQQTYHDDHYDHTALDNDTQLQEDNNDTSSALDKKLKSKMLDELYKLDYEDVIGGMPTRFKYRQVERNDYGLSTEEILFSRDTTLKQYVSLGQMAPYTDGGEYFPGTKRRRKFRECAKKDAEELWRETEAETTQDHKLSAQTDMHEDGDQDRPKKRKRRRQKKGTKKQGMIHQVSNENDAINGHGVGNSIHTTKPVTKHKNGKEKENIYDSTFTSGPNNTQISSKKNKTDDKLERKGKIKESESHEMIQKKEKRNRKKKKKKSRIEIEGVASSRLASYGL